MTLSLAALFQLLLSSVPILPYALLLYLLFRCCVKPYNRRRCISYINCRCWIDFYCARRHGWLVFICMPFVVAVIARFVTSGLLRFCCVCWVVHVLFNCLPCVLVLATLQLIASLSVFTRCWCLFCFHYGITH